ncbi:MAG: LysR family transcriptional regulator [Candidatus Andeanibacterium colombiense]|uniref:LysR family transcriptional regulator n=1 Tax=Candidatus Andeanibacterium colombiense TaxID=3121345 RepID=A0AAJ6BPS7_9SPHN|nr:MAG: LysR family transcriptional regulator [Sphingomonadaceae bacterium]
MSGAEIAMGPGKADLLDAIEAAGSISAAARSMGMSYRRAWLLVDAMNRCFTEPLVETHPGGGQQAGAKLTEKGRQVREAYRALVEMATQGAQGVALGTLTRSLKA